MVRRHSCLLLLSWDIFDLLSLILMVAVDFLTDGLNLIEEVSSVLNWLNFFFFLHLLRWLQSTLLWHNACVSKTHHAVQNLAKRKLQCLWENWGMSHSTFYWEIEVQKDENVNGTSNTILFVVHKVEKYINTTYKRSTLPWKDLKFVCGSGSHIS